MLRSTSKNSKSLKVRRMTGILIGEGLVVVFLIMCLSMIQLVDKHKTDQDVVNVDSPQITGAATLNSELTPTIDPVIQQQEEQKMKEEERAAYLLKADLIATGYDYDGAIEYIKAYGEDYTQYTEFTQAIDSYEKSKLALVPFGAYSSATEVNHIFFHSLIYDTAKAFDGDKDSNGYNYYMTTINEFKEMMQQMYDQGYVLVSIHDVVKQITKEDGTTTFTEGDILLPPDKKPFVLSQDDVNYYDYMDGDGFASRMVIDENGRPSTAMLLDDGSEVVGEFDLVPVLETFISEHPDFSYKGARGLICLTGYEGTLGYRTDPASKDLATYEQDKETVKKVATVMREYGWEFACHSNGHRDMAECTQEFLEYDTKQWRENVGSLIGDTDVYVYPYGIDIQSGIKTYSNARYKYLKSSGFNIFCGVEAKPWMQIKTDYVRMQRRPLDGQAMLMYPKRLEDLFDLTKVIDPARPALK